MFVNGRYLKINNTLELHNVASEGSLNCDLCLKMYLLTMIFRLTDIFVHLQCLQNEDTSISPRPQSSLGFVMGQVTLRKGLRRPILLSPSLGKEAGFPGVPLSSVGWLRDACLFFFKPLSDTHSLKYICISQLKK